MMNALPQGWIETTLAGVAQIDMGQSPAGEFTNTRGIGLPLVGGAADYKDGKIIVSRYSSSPTKISEIGDLILCIRATIGKVAFGDQKYCLGRGVAGLRAFVEPKLLFYKLQESAKKLDEAGVGSTFRQIDKKTLEGWPILLPPIAEQQRIVEKLESLGSKLERAKYSLKYLPLLIERYKQSILEAAFNGSLTNSWRQAHKAKIAQLVELREVAIDFTYGTSSKSSRNGKVPVLRMGNIQDGKLTWDELVYTSNENDIKKYTLSTGDVLFNRTNSPELVGKTAVFREKHEAIFAGYLIRVRCSEKLIPEYLSYCLNSPPGRAYCYKVKNDGISQSNINAKKLAAFRLLIPTVDEQNEVVRLIELSFRWIDSVSKKIADTTELLLQLNQAILYKAFCGELTIQNKDDEPAKVLLERIRREKELLRAKKKPRSIKRKNKDANMNRKLIEVLSSTDDWISAQEAFSLCGVGETATTEDIEPVYAEMRELDQSGRLLVKSILDDSNRKLYDLIKINK